MSVVTSDTASAGVNIASDWGSGFVAGVTITAEQALAGILPVFGTRRSYPASAIPTPCSLWLITPMSGKAVV